MNTIAENESSEPGPITIDPHSDLGRALIELRRDTVALMSETAFNQVEFHMATRILSWVRQSQRELAKRDFELANQDHQ